MAFAHKARAQYRVDTNKQVELLRVNADRAELDVAGELRGWLVNLLGSGAR